MLLDVRYFMAQRCNLSIFLNSWDKRGLQMGEQWERGLMVKESRHPVLLEALECPVFAMLLQSSKVTEDFRLHFELHVGQFNSDRQTDRQTDRQSAVTYSQGLATFLVTPIDHHDCQVKYQNKILPVYVHKLLYTCS